MKIKSILKFNRWIRNERHLKYARKIFAWPKEKIDFFIDMLIGIFFLFRKFINKILKFFYNFFRV